MLRNSFIIFISGWVLWFWIDKPRTGLQQFLRTDDSMLVNFQRSFDLLKSGYFAQSYIYIWNAHYIVLSVIFGTILSVFYGFISAYLRRKRVRNSFVIPSAMKRKHESEPELELGIKHSTDEK